MTSELTALKSFFTSNHIVLSPTWFESCVTWCKSETLGPNYSPHELQAKVHEQWLLLDLRDVEVPVLPPNLASKEKFTITGNFCVQMMQIVDISKPKLWQLQKIRNSHPLTKGTQQDADVVGTGKRVLQMTLTDGVQEVEAMEYRPVPALSLNLPPGTKIKIIGPVVVRRGRIMLEQSNIEVLGGEVDELLVSHAAENVLAKALKMPLNPNPVLIEEKLFVVEKEEKYEGYMTNFDLKKPTAPPVIFTKEEEDLMNEEFETLMEVENEIRRQNEGHTTSVTKNELKSSISTPLRPQEFNNLSRSSTSTQVQQQKSSFQLQNQSVLSLDDDDDDVFKDIDIDAHLNQAQSKSAGSVIVTIAEIKNKHKNGVLKIKAKFTGVEEKLTLTDCEYKIAIKIADATGELIVAVHSDIIAEFAECSASDITILKTNILDNNKAAVQKIMETIQKVKERLLLLNSVMMIQVETGKRPVVIKVL